MVMGWFDDRCFACGFRCSHPCRAPTRSHEPIIDSLFHQLVPNTDCASRGLDRTARHVRFVALANTNAVPPVLRQNPGIQKPAREETESAMNLGRVPSAVRLRLSTGTSISVDPMARLSRAFTPTSGIQDA